MENGLIGEIEQGREDWAFHLGTLAYVWGYPLLECWKDRLKKVRPATPGDGVHAAALINAFRHVRELSSARSSEFVSAASDFLYSTAVIDLRNGPLQLTAADFGARWYGLQVLDARMETLANLGTRTFGDQLPRVVLANASDVLDSAADTITIRSGIAYLYIVARLAVRPGEDAALVHPLQDALRLAPLGPHTHRELSPRALPEPDPAHAELAFFDALGAVIREVPPRADEGMLHGLLGEIGLSVEHGFRPDLLSPGARRGLVRAIAEGDALLDRKIYEAGSSRNGWWLVRDIGTYGSNYIIRALVARHGIWANVPEESLYFIARTDAEGKLLHGSHRYRLRFAPGATPPVAAFWSISYYDEHGRIMSNAVDRFAIHSQDQRLALDPDGGLTLDIGMSPATDRDGNWLPSHDGHFTLNLRCYNPLTPLLDGAYVVPPIARVA